MRRQNEDRSPDVLIVGGGTAGAALAGILARDPGRTVMLLEAGPDYGARTSGAWPLDLLDARHLSTTHDWGYGGVAHPMQTRRTPFERARVLGGCSAHNGCVALLGHRCDYDHWAETGNPGWGWQSVAPAFARARQALRVRFVADDELTPFHAAFMEGAVVAGIPRVHDLNDPDACTGVAAAPVNITDGIRWNSAFGYLDPVRGQANLVIVSHALVDRVVIADGRAVAVEAIVDGSRRRIAAGQIVLAAGAYGSPAILLRSGIGAPDALHALGITPSHALPGVGQGLTDHPAVELRYRASARLNDAMRAFEKRQWRPDEQTLAKARSSRCRDAFDLHLYSVVTALPQTEEYTCAVVVSAVAARSAGSLTLASADPTAAPRIDHGYLRDPDGEDLAVLTDGIALAREVMAGASWAYDAAQMPDLVTASAADLADGIRRAVGIYYHPACSCRMGPASDPAAVVDAMGAVHGIDRLTVCDASIFPTLMRANTNLPAAMLSEHLAPAIGAG